jgi:hypothetical protein
MPRPLFTPGKDPVPIVQEAGWAPRPVWTSAENLASTRIRCPDRPARSQSPIILNIQNRNIKQKRAIKPVSKANDGSKREIEEFKNLQCLLSQKC